MDEKQQVIEILVSRFPWLEYEFRSIPLDAIRYHGIVQGHEKMRDYGLIMAAFTWADTPQGEVFWHDVHERFYNGDVLPLTPE